MLYLSSKVKSTENLKLSLRLNGWYLLVRMIRKKMLNEVSALYLYISEKYHVTASSNQKAGSTGVLWSVPNKNQLYINNKHISRPALSWLFH